MSNQAAACRVSGSLWHRPTNGKRRNNSGASPGTQVYGHHGDNQWRKRLLRVMRTPPVSLCTASRQRAQNLKPPLKSCPMGTERWSKPSLLPITVTHTIKTIAIGNHAHKDTYTEHYEPTQAPVTHRSPPVNLVNVGEVPAASQHYAKYWETSVERPHPPSRHNNMHLYPSTWEAVYSSLVWATLQNPAPPLPPKSPPIVRDARNQIQLQIFFLILND